ncbi:unnamed protein product, partial [Bubo scandiacus]
SLPLPKLSMHLTSKCYSMSSQNMGSSTDKTIGQGLFPVGNIDKVNLSLVGEEGSL